MRREELAGREVERDSEIGSKLSSRGEEDLTEESRHLPLGGRAEEGGESVWHPEQGDRRPASGWGTGIACQPLGKREPIMCSLCA